MKLKMTFKPTPALLVAADILALVAAFFGGYVFATIAAAVLNGETFMKLGSATMRPWLWLYVTQLLVMLIVLGSKGHYTQRSPWWEQVKYVMMVCIGNLLVAGCVMYVMKVPFSRLWLVGCFALLLPLIMLMRLVARRIAMALTCWGTDVAIVGGPENVLETIFALNSDSYNSYRVKEIHLLGTNALIDVEALPTAQQGAKQALVRTEQLTGLVKKSRCELFIAAPDEATRLDVAAFMHIVLEHPSKSVGFVMPMSGLSLYGMDVQHFFGSHTAMLKPKRKMAKPINRVFKRALDLFGASVGLVLLSVPMLALALMIRKDGGKAFYFQNRVGRNGKPFKCWKLRSMVPNAEEVLKGLLANDPQARAEWETDFKLKNDPRITKIGAVIRKTSVDELPQLWNVIKGEMSLVGPRPIVTKELDYYGKHKDDYLATKPGLTGLWQVSGRNDTSYAYRVYLDSWYVAHWSLWTDIVIIIQTVGILVNRKGAY